MLFQVKVTLFVHRMTLTQKQNVWGQRNADIDSLGTDFLIDRNINSVSIGLQSQHVPIQDSVEASKRVMSAQCGSNVCTRNTQQSVHASVICYF